MNSFSEYDQYCHNILGFLYANRLNPNTKLRWTFKELKDRFPDISLMIFEDMIAIIFNDGFLDSDKNLIPTGAPSPLIYFSISHKGIAFVFSDTYMNRRNRNILQLQLLESQIKSNESVIATNENIKTTNANIQATNANTASTNGILKWIFGITTFISLLQLIVSIYGIISNKSEIPNQSHLRQQDSIIRMQGIRLFQKESQEYHYLNEIDSLKNALDSANHKP